MSGLDSREVEIYEVIPPEKVNPGRVVCVEVPGSKSITNRALLIAAMADGESIVRNAAASEDASYFLEALIALGFAVRAEGDGEGKTVHIQGSNGEIPKKEAEIYVGSAGTAARFLCAMLAFSDGSYTVRASEQMKKRPMEPLIAALREAGAEVCCLEEADRFPMRITGAKKKGVFPKAQRLRVDIGKSSQFLSALLIAAGAAGERLSIEAVGRHGMNYVEMTLAMMRDFGVEAEIQTGEESVVYHFEKNGGYRGRTYEIEPDVSAACYFFALAAVLGASVAVTGVKRRMLQGDIRFLDVVEQLGAKLTEQDGRLVVTGPEDGRLHGGFTLDMSAFSDQALTLAAIAPFADAPVTITGIGHIRLQECDRIQAIAHNLGAMGIACRESEDSVTIGNGAPAPCIVETYEDHRVAMSFALTGLRAGQIRIRNPRCCKKTFAGYFEVLEHAVADLQKA